MAASLTKVAGAFPQARLRAAAPARTDMFGTMRVATAGGVAAYSVKVDGSDDFAPCTMAVAAHDGDRVVVRNVGHTLVVVANKTTPAVMDDRDYAVVKDISENADKLLDEIRGVATSAEKTMEQVMQDMATSGQGVQQIKEYVGYSDEAVKTIAERVDESEHQLVTINNAAAEAGERADEATLSAKQALGSALSAEADLSWLENLVGVVEWIAQHRRLTADQVPVEGKRYFADAGSGTMRQVEPYDYTPATGDAPVAGTDYYEVVDGVMQPVYAPSGEGMFAYTPTADAAIVPGKAYYEPSYKYAPTSDREVVEGKQYFLPAVTYAPTGDASVVAGKEYYARDSGGYALVEDPVDADIASYYERVVAYERVAFPQAEDIGSYLERMQDGYAPVASPAAADLPGYYERSVSYYVRAAQNPQQRGYYELDDALSQFIGAHVSLDSTGMNLRFDDSSCFIRIGSLGGVDPDKALYILDGTAETGQRVLGKYGENSQTGSLAGTHIEARGVRFSFWAAGYDYKTGVCEALTNGDVAGRATSDASVVAGKAYFTRAASSRARSGYQYTAVMEPQAAALSSYYEATVGPDTALPGEVAYIAVKGGQSVFYMNRAVVMSELRFSKWSWLPRGNGNLSLKWIG